MNDETRTKNELIDELHLLRDRVAGFENGESEQRLRGVNDRSSEGMAHDFNNILTGINGYSALVPDELSEGTGLGFSTVYGIVKQHNGYVWLHSQPGHGTVVKVYLPRAELGLEQPSNQLTTGEAPSGTETILLVEDDDTVRKLTAGILERSGYKVR